MSKWRNKIGVFEIFVIAFIIYFGAHIIHGYHKCVNSEYAICPGHDAEIEEEESVFDD